MRGKAPLMAAMARLARSVIARRALRVIEQRQHRLGNARRVAHLLAAAGAQQRRIGIAEVLEIGAGQHRRTELDRLDRVLPAALGKRAADKGDGRQRIEQAKLADRVGHVDVGRSLGQLGFRAERDVKAGGP